MSRHQSKLHAIDEDLKDLVIEADEPGFWDTPAPTPEEIAREHEDPEPLGYLFEPDWDDTTGDTE